MEIGIIDYELSNLGGIRSAVKNWDLNKVN